MPVPLRATPVAELRLDGITHGAEAVGRLPDGKACFVPYAIPGEVVRVEVVEEHPRWARARLLEVLEPSGDRVAAPCPLFGPDRCGGCQLQHVAAPAQALLKRRILTEQLVRIGGITDPPVAETVVVQPFGYRTHARFAVAPDGRLAFRRHASHDLVPVDRCLLLTDAAQALRDRAGDDWGGAEEVVITTTSAGQTALLVTPGDGGLPALPDGDDPLALMGRAGRAAALRGEVALREQVGGRTFRVSPTSFFQVSPQAALVLSQLVVEAAAPQPGETALDLHAGVGLFAAVLAEAGARVTAVEQQRAAADDARENLADLEVEVITGDAATLVRELASAHEQRDIVVLDPPRKGAGGGLCQQVAALDPRVIVYVACDPAALARDARALAGAGYELTAVVPVDQFAQTAHIEAVATFRPAYRLEGAGA